MTTSEFRLARTGRAALVFNGEMLGEASCAVSERSGAARTWTVRLYRTAGGKIVAAAAYDSDWEGELPFSTAEVVADLAAAEEWLRALDPTPPVSGFPAGAQFVERQARLMADVRRRYLTAVGDALADAGAEERID